MKPKLPKFSIKNRKTQILLLIITFTLIVMITQRDSPGIVAGVFLAVIVLVVAFTKQEKNINEIGADGENRIRSEEERKSLLREFVVSKVATGSRVELQDDFSAVLVYGTKPNHVLHFILSILTAGFWLIIWLFIALGSKERRTLYKINEYGTIKF